jgi:predicted MFS family arabinose efflux permease
MFIGGTFGMMLAGLLGTFIGWRLCFFLVGLPGFILAIFSWNISEEKRHHTQLLKLERSTFEYIFKSKPYMLTIAGGVMLTFTSASIISWITEFLIRYHNYTVSEASVTFGIIVLIAGIAGIYSGGYLADRFFKVYNLPRSFIIAVCFIISSPVLYIIITTENKYLLIITLIIATFLMSMYYGPSVSLIQDILPKYKATAYAFYLFFAHLLGSTIAPSVIGKVSDLSNLRSALYIPVITNFAGGLLFLITTRLMYSINSKNTIS